MDRCFKKKARRRLRVPGLSRDCSTTKEGYSLAPFSISELMGRGFIGSDLMGA